MAGSQRDFAITTMVGTLPFSFEQHVGLADGVSLGIDFLPVEQTFDILIVLRGERRKCLFGDCKHAAGPAGAIVEEVRSRLDAVLNGQEHEVSHQPHCIARCPVFTCFFSDGPIALCFAHPRGTRR